ncbi:TetR family transcriptional regulator C-terminal domain-containing protein [Saccharopolyspora erythraea]|uniref:TetR/AcrR family transcriptional regulator n=1 Tax=Saccharopolyspora erythraea TaxID=1836 RepID=UPI001BAC8E48|nr:TetR/AcrR family transcriptional regulator [Saccharopolyspora erythraea]QUH02717.1 TetR family transcriptional regulator C-terminal domain-containing protein [Saccharopolyspora erythraea]
MQDTTAELRQRVRDVSRRYPGSQRAFAEQIGLDATKLSKSLTGTRRFTPAELTRIAEVTGVTVNWLINGGDDAETAVAVPRRSARSEQGPGGSGDAGRYQQILDAAWHLIAERGYHSVRVSDVAQACGTSAATIHYYFPGRRDLLIETLRYSVKLAFDRQVAELHSISDAHERLLRLVELQLPTEGLLRSEWSIWLQVWNESALDPDLQVLHSDSYTRWHDTIARTIREGQQQGVFTDRDAEELTVTLTALIDGLGVQVLAGRPGRTVRRMRQVLRDFVEREIARH